MIINEDYYDKEYFKSLSYPKTLKIFGKIASRFEEIERDYIYYNPDEESIINVLSDNHKYDIYRINRRGKLKLKRNKNKLQVIGLRFKYIKRYIIIVQIKEEMAV